MKKIGVSVEITGIVVRGGANHRSWRTQDPFDFAATGVCDNGAVRIKGLTGRGTFTRAYLKALTTELKKFGLVLVEWDRAEK